VDDYSLWTPDSQQLVFSSERDEGDYGIYRMLADGTGQEERLMTIDGGNGDASSFSPNGEQLLFRENQNLHLLTLGDGSTPQPIVRSEFIDRAGAISPDGQWLAYESTESGRTNIHVQPFPDSGGLKWQISTTGGEEPRWGPEGQELFYRDNEAVLVVPIDDGPGFRSGAPEQLFSGSYVYRGSNRPSYDVSPDGQRFVMLNSQELAGQIGDQTALTVVENWFEELIRLAPPSE
jgi:serine/threonine-protein kinase